MFHSPSSFLYFFCTAKLFLLTDSMSIPSTPSPSVSLSLSLFLSLSPSLSSSLSLVFAIQS